MDKFTAYSSSPKAQLFIAGFLALVMAGLTLLISLQGNYFGLQRLYVTNTELGLFLAHAPQVQVVALGKANKRLEVLASDLVEDPDVFANQAELNNFLFRQAEFHQLLTANELVVEVKTLAGDIESLQLTAAPSRPLVSLPATFWVQLVTGLGGFIIGFWVKVLRPKDLAAKCFMLTGVGLMLAAWSAAVYSSRELALNLNLFNSLLFLNQSGSLGFGFALLGLFLYFPKPLVKPRWLKALGGVFLFLVALKLSGWVNSTYALTYLPILLLSLIILATITWQAVVNRRSPYEFAALRWLGLVTLATVGCFLFLVALPILIGNLPPLPQGIAFGFFLILYAGLALGLKRYKLFELDLWAFHLLLWVVAGLALIGLDLVFLLVLNWQHANSLLAALIICGFVYLPVRSWLWYKLVEKPSPPARQLFDALVALALTPKAESFTQGWQQLLTEIFTPLAWQAVSPEQMPIQPNSACLEEDGRTIYIPAIGEAPALRLMLAEKGRRLFVPKDLAFIKEILDMLSFALASRRAREEGELQERQRIAEDLHDDLGARLLTGLYQTELSQVQETLQLALADMRCLVRDLAGEKLPLEVSLGEIRKETQARFAATSCKLAWHLPDLPLNKYSLDYATNRQLTSLLREVFTNILRHAQASLVEVAIELTSEELVIKINDNGQGYTGESKKEDSYGQQNLKKREQALNAKLSFTLTQQGTLTGLQLPLTKLSVNFHYPTRDNHLPHD